MNRNIKLCSLIAAFLPGCAHQKVSFPSYHPGAPTVTMKSPDESQYNLYVPGDKVPVICDVVLYGDPVGFARDETGQLQAVAGRDVRVLKEGAYKWKRFGGPPAPVRRSIHPTFQEADRIETAIEFGISRLAQAMNAPDTNPRAKGHRD